MEDPKSTSERVQGKEKVAANSLKNLVYSIPMSVEDKVVLEGGHDKQIISRS